ncbi:glycosyltransferase family 4 protein [Christiangramia sp. OXR-203]|jgi:glycosyltransferase involved in cell wall biosynthesis|uniref:glycosyltransferase family 4 protein n=1 Tax=Christiangramia sp. OXR-203 TaxID=3100176 RepID=UPI002AC8BEF2|nr:glycosyltransferase family 4 protein [Christiangramia sp. OXR-203]WPY99734.1 glycosyltransferase family 4 protein [Christiangramia sp. OXR-203]
MQKLVRVTTIPLSLEKLLEGQLTFMSQHYQVIAVAADEKRLEKYGVDNNVETYAVELTRAITPIADLKAVFKLTSYLRKEKPLIIHSHTPKAGIISMLAGWLAGVPIRLHTVAGLPLLEVKGFKRRILDFVEKLTYKLAHKVFPNSFELKKIILDLNYANESKLKVLGNGSSNGIDTTYFDPQRFTEDFKSDLRSKFGIPQEDIVFVFVGRLVKEKGIEELVRAFNELRVSSPKCSLLLIGPYEQDLDPISEEIIQEIEKNPKIITTGYELDVRPYFAIANILTFPSYREGFPNVVLQAGAMSLPAIVSNINGCNEIIQNGENGIIIPVKSEEALKVAMKKLVDDIDLRSQLTLNARQVIQKKYEREYFWQILLKEYKELESSLKHD